VGKRVLLKLPPDFQETLSDLLKVKPPPKPEKPARKRKTQKRATKRR
jgi:hypothetical protein